MRLSGPEEKLTYICHVVNTVAGPLAPDDPHGQASHTEEDGDGHGETNEKTEVSDDHADTISREMRSLIRSAHPPSTASSHQISSAAEVSTISRRRLTAGPSLVLGTVGAAGGPGGPGGPTSVN